MFLFRPVSVMAIIFLSTQLFSACDIIAPKAKKPAKITTSMTNEALPKEALTIKKQDTQVPSMTLPENVVAQVGSWILTKEDFINRLTIVAENMKDFDPQDEESQAAVLEELVRQQVLAYEAKKMKLHEKKEIISALKDLENTLLVQELVGVLTKEVSVSAEEAQQFYQANQQLFTTPEERKMREIVVSSQSEAKDILVLLLQGASFSETAKERSKSSTASGGGDLGWLTVAPFEAMLKASIGLNKGEVSTVFEGPEGYYIVKVDDIKGGEIASFADIQEELIRLMTMQKQQEVVLQKIQDVAKEINVEVNVDLLKN